MDTMAYLQSAVVFLDMIGVLTALKAMAVIGLAVGAWKVLR